MRYYCQREKEAIIDRARRTLLKLRLEEPMQPIRYRTQENALIQRPPRLRYRVQENGRRKP